jgi:hypothetical protein
MCSTSVQKLVTFKCYGNALSCKFYCILYSEIDQYKGCRNVSFKRKKTLLNKQSCYLFRLMKSEVF